MNFYYQIEKRPRVMLAITFVLVALFSTAVYFPGLPGEFLFDDYQNIINNNLVHIKHLDFANAWAVLSAKQVSGYGRSLPMLSFAIDFARANGADPLTFKLTNLFIHSSTSLVLVFFFRNVLLLLGMEQQSALRTGAVLAVAWAVHPLQVSAVLYVVQRIQALGTFFLVLALIAYIQTRRRQILGQSAAGWILATIAFWSIALLCKEDSAVLPLLTLSLELTIFHFRAADLKTARYIKSSYWAAIFAAVLIYAFWIVPKYWSWEAYPGRNFSTMERLLTEPRVLCLYIGQILFPLPQHMPFYYDWLEPSRTLFNPWTTLPSLALVTLLLIFAWRMKERRPAFALGVFFFFGAHLITSNVIGLELAFEHRNHFALIGAVLAIYSLITSLLQRFNSQTLVKYVVCSLILFSLATATISRARTWRSGVSLSRAGTIAAPHSPRAWMDLCDALFVAGGGVGNPRNPNLNAAIQACNSGVNSNPETLNSLAALISLKTIRGDIDATDWARYQERLNRVFISPDNARATFIFTHYAGLGVKVEKKEVLRAFSTLDRRHKLDATDLDKIGVSIMRDFKSPDDALPYFLKALSMAPVGDSYGGMVAEDLRKSGRADLSRVVEAASREKGTRD